LFSNAAYTVVADLLEQGAQRIEVNEFYAAIISGQIPFASATRAMRELAAR